MANTMFKNVRIAQKHDVEANWKLATNFIPLNGEIIVYSEDENYTYPRFKIGNGIDNVDALPFVEEHLIDYLQTYTDNKLNTMSSIEVSETEPTNENVDIWLDPTLNETVNIPEINDNTISTVDTWSSQKISDIVANAGSVKSVNGVEPDANGNIEIQVSAEDIGVDLSNYYTKTEINNTINALDIPEKLADLTGDSTHRVVTDSQISAWNAKSDFSGNYNDLTNKPSIPTKVGQLTNDTGYLVQMDLAGYAKHDEIPTGTLAMKDFVNKDDLDSDIQASLNKADTALQSFTETDPTVPAWAKASTKPTYAASEVGAYSTTEIDTKLSVIDLSIANITNGAAAVQKAKRADSAEYSENANYATNADSATYATRADYANKATQADEDDTGNLISMTYETKEDAESKLQSAKTYADNAAAAAANTVKNDLLNGAGTAYDTLKELGDLIVENQDAIEALETIASGKANASHTHNAQNIIYTGPDANYIPGEDNIENILLALDSAITEKSNTNHGHTLSGYASDDGIVKLSNILSYQKDTVTFSASHATSGVTAGTYNSVTVNEYGHVTAGTNPNTLAGYGITDAASKTHNHAISDITNLQTTLDAKVPTSRTINGKALSSNITLSASDVSAYSKTEVDALWITIDDIDEICGATVQVATD